MDSYMLLRRVSPIHTTFGLHCSVSHDARGPRTLCTKYRDNIVLIPRIALDGEFPFEWRRRQFPVRVCFAMTINKSQGQTLERAGIYLAEDVFAHGQLYVARRVSPIHTTFGLHCSVSHDARGPRTLCTKKC